MSPHPGKITRERLIETAWALAEQEGIEKLSLARLADALGIAAPSLYHHMRGKADLIRAVNERTIEMLFSALYGAADQGEGQPQAQITALAHAYRVFAHAHPVTYALAFTTIDPAARPDAADQERAVLPLQAIMARISGEARSLDALRGLLALIHGFVMLELNAQLRRGGDSGAAFDYAVRAYLTGCAMEGEAG
jgi:AcrR family transcriptional regulator